MIDCLYALVLLAIFTAAIISAIRWRKLATADRIISVLLWLTVLQECVALIVSHTMGNNMITYHVYSAAELLAITAYFAASHNGITRTGIICIGIVGLLFSIINSVWIQDLNSANTYFLIVEASIVLILSMTALFRIALDERSRPLEMMQFWVTLSFLLYWSVTFAAYGMMGLLTPNTQLTTVAISVLQSANVLFYMSVAVLLVRYPKLIPTGGRQ